jgi:hypothetical protein
MRRRQQGGPAGPPQSEPPPGYLQWTGLSPLMQRAFANYASFPKYQGLGGYSNVLKFGRGGRTKTPLELLHLLKLSSDLPPRGAIFPGHRALT